MNNLESIINNNNISITLISQNIRRNKILQKELFDKTQFLPSTYTNSPRLFCLINNINKTPICACGKLLKWSNKFNRGFNKTCGDKKCIDTQINISHKQTCLTHYGVASHFNDKHIKTKIKNILVKKYNVTTPFSSKEIRHKAKNTNIERYGYENPAKNEDVKNKIKETNIQRYGFNNPTKNEDVKNKIKETNIERYGFDSPIKNKEIRNKIKETNIERYGFDNPTKNKDVKNKIKKTYFEKYTKSRIYEFLNSQNINLNNVKFIDYKNIEYTCPICNYKSKLFLGYANSRIYSNINFCLKCVPKNIFSKGQQELKDFIINLGHNVIENYKLQNKKEIDIYIPSIKLGIEYNGIYWHQELFKGKNYHKDKTIQANKENINLIHIWEDQWLFQKNIVKSIIKNKLNKSNRIYARKCIIKKVQTNDTKIFLNKNHLQRNVPSSIKLGLYYNDELVSIMTFGQRKISGKINYELLRFCNKLNITVIGGASKLFKYFLNNYNVLNIISYANKDISNGNLYKQLNFKYTKETSPTYWWVKDTIRESRNKYQKHKLIKEGFDNNLTENEIMYNRGFFKIYNSGNYVFTYEKNN